MFCLLEFFRVFRTRHDRSISGHEIIIRSKLLHDLCRVKTQVLRRTTPSLRATKGSKGVHSNPDCGEPIGGLRLRDPSHAENRLYFRPQPTSHHLGCVVVWLCIAILYVWPYSLHVASYQTMSWIWSGQLWRIFQRQLISTINIERSELRTAVWDSNTRPLIGPQLTIDPRGRCGHWACQPTTSTMLLQGSQESQEMHWTNGACPRPGRTREHQQENRAQLKPSSLLSNL